MNNKLLVVILLGSAGLTAAIGVAGAQIAYAIVLGGFYAGTMTGANPPGIEVVKLHWLVIGVIIVLVVSGLYFLIWPEKSNEI
jgi:hypothetical protein